MKKQHLAGHMVRAQKVIKEKLKIIDIIFELVDARLPLSSRSPFIAGILRNKPGLLILNKADLANPGLTGLWVKWFRRQGMPAIVCESVGGAGTKEIYREVSFLIRAGKVKPKTASLRLTRCIIVGIPNVGKSMFINRLAGRKAARTGDLPGLTRGEQWIRIGTKIELLDTPGILRPRLNDPETAIKLAATGAIREDSFEPEAVSAWILEWLVNNKKKELENRYGPGTAFLDFESMLEIIGRKKGLLVSGGLVDRKKAALQVIKEFRLGMFGRCTLEYPPEEEKISF